MRCGAWWYRPQFLFDAIRRKKKKDFKFGHGNEHQLPNGTTLIDSYHCSRYNTNTGRLTEQMFEDIFLRAFAKLLENNVRR